MIQKNLVKKGSSKKAIAIRDPLQQYLQEVHRYPMLTREEEQELARRYREEGDVEAAKQLVATHLRLVARIAAEYRNAYHNVLDLIQEGNLGLMQAVAHFDPEKGARLATYATWWIKSYILKYILDNFRLIKVGTTKQQKKLFYNLMREKERIEAMGYYATPLELSKRLGVGEEEVREMQQRLQLPEYGLQAPVKGGEEGGAILQDFLAVDGTPADEQLAAAQSRDLLEEKFREFAEGLDEREKKIFQERLLSELPLTLQEIADEYGISKERVRQIEGRLIERLKSSFEEQGIGPESIQMMGG